MSETSPTAAQVLPGLIQSYEDSPTAQSARRPGCAPGMLSWARAFPGIAAQARVARHFVASLLDGSALRDDAVTVLSELFTNALEHTASGLPGGLIIVQVSRWRHGVRIAVTDQGSLAQPVIRDPGASSGPAENGRGLYLAASLACQLTWHDDTCGRTVSAILGAPPPRQRRPESLALRPGFPRHQPSPGKETSP